MVASLEGAGDTALVTSVSVCRHVRALLTGDTTANVQVTGASSSCATLEVRSDCWTDGHCGAIILLQTPMVAVLPQARQAAGHIAETTGTPFRPAGTLIPNENFPHSKISRSLKAAYNLIADSNSGFPREKVRG